VNSALQVVQVISFYAGFGLMLLVLALLVSIVGVALIALYEAGGWIRSRRWRPTLTHLKTGRPYS
jgi:hypothetical protein